MDTFSAEWLALREPEDTAARAVSLTRKVAGVFAHTRVLDVLDLGTGTGANVRYLTEYLPAHQRWLLVDHDPALLDTVAPHMHAWGDRHRYAAEPLPGGLLLRTPVRACEVTTRQMSLTDLDDASPFEGRALVTASALLDLVSERWIRDLATRCRDAKAAVLFALTYDGRVELGPEEPEDDTIRGLVNRHQHGDKGFGPALGPDAPRVAQRCFVEAGYQVRFASSDWVLPPSAGALQRQLIDGWATAAAEVAPTDAPAIASWRARRLAHVDASRSRVRVGHQDMAAWLPL